MAKEWRQDRDEMARVAWLKAERKIAAEGRLSKEIMDLVQWGFIAGFEAGSHYAAEVASDIMAGRR